MFHILFFKKYSVICLSIVLVLHFSLLALQIHLYCICILDSSCVQFTWYKQGALKDWQRNIIIFPVSSTPFFPLVPSSWQPPYPLLFSAPFSPAHPSTFPALFSASLFMIYLIYLYIAFLCNGTQSIVYHFPTTTL